MLAIIYKAIIFYALYAVIKRLLGAFEIYRNIKKVKASQPKSYARNTYSNKEDIVDVEYHELNN